MARTLAEARGNDADAWDVRLMHADPAEVYNCVRCGTLWRVGDYTDLEQRYVDERYEPAELAWLHERGREDLGLHLEWFGGNGVRPGATVFEVGCYVGSFLWTAQCLGAEAWGIDPNPAMVAFCRTLGLHAEQASLEAHQTDDACVDVVALLKCLDQMVDPEAALRSCRRMLRPDGHLLMSTPDADWLRSLYTHPARRGTDTARRQLVFGLPFLRCYRVPGIAQLLERVGLELTSVRTTPSSPWIHLAARPVPVGPIQLHPADLARCR